MRIGVCGYLTGRNNSGLEFNFPQSARQAGFDYLELPLSTVAGLTELEFSGLLQAVTAAGLPCEACNVFFPARIRLTGPDVDWRAVEAYVRLALGRAARLGIQVVVFGSGGARQVPEGFPSEQAWQQLIQLLRLVDPIAAGMNLTLAIEPLNRAECNIIQTGSEGFTLAKLVNRPNIKLLLDNYHMYHDQEDYGIAVTARDWIRHVHISNPETHGYPVEVNDDLAAFCRALKRSGYAGRVSIEAGYRDFQSKLPGRWQCCASY